jgi:hypothetical protein
MDLQSTFRYRIYHRDMFSVIQEFFCKDHIIHYDIYLHIYDIHSSKFFYKSIHKNMLLHCSLRHRFLYHNNSLPFFSFYRVGKDLHDNFFNIYVCYSSIFSRISYHIEKQLFLSYILPFFDFFHIDIQ